MHKITIDLTDDEFNRVLLAFKSLKRLEKYEATDEELLSAIIHSYLQENVVAYEATLSSKQAGEVAEQKAKDEIVPDKGVEDLPVKPEAIEIPA